MLSAYLIQICFDLALAYFGITWDLEILHLDVRTIVTQCAYDSSVVFGNLALEGAMHLFETLLEIFSRYHLCCCNVH